MRDHGKMPWELRLELFVADLDVTADFYTSVMGFVIADDRRHTDLPYLGMRRDQVRIGAVPSSVPVDQSARALPAGTEIVLEADDVTAERDRIVTKGWALADDLKIQPWGLTDFRLHDPDGYYLRVTSKQTPP